MLLFSSRGDLLVPHDEIEGPTTRTTICVTSSLKGIIRGGVLGIHGSLNTLTRGTQGPSCMRSSLIMWMTSPPSMTQSTISSRSLQSVNLWIHIAKEHDGLNFLPISIFGFIDCLINCVSRPFSGPDGDYFGAPQKAMIDAAQRSVYTGYKKCHGIKVETVLLPNGISTVFGPTSAWIHDIGGVLQMSGLDSFLVQIQQSKPQVYCAFGDSAYNAQYLQCIRSYYISPSPGEDITDDQKICNNQIKPCHQAIEWNYGDVKNYFQIFSQPQNYKLGASMPFVKAQLCICHLLSNIYTCLNGNKASSYMKFDIMPPTLEEY